LAVINQVLSNKAKYSPNANDQETGNADVEAPYEDNRGSTSTSSLSADE
jgi:ATP-dependent Clp protease ATP-binding subunit ClpC